MLGIDWQQILLHLFNFALLALIVNILLYLPVKSFIEKRQQYYKDLDDQTKKNLKESEQSIKLHDQKLREIDEEIKQIKLDALKDAKKISDKEIRLAKEEAKKIIQDSKIESQREREKIIRKTKRELKQVVVETATKLALFNGDVYDDFIEYAKEDEDE